ncbi:hypothetical protein AgCh_031098 [Apium graveolens]
MTLVGDVSSFHNTEKQFKVNETTDFSRNVNMFLQGKVQGGIKELEGLEAKVKASRACQLVVKDMQEEFVRDYVFPFLRAGAGFKCPYNSKLSKKGVLLSPYHQGDELIWDGTFA